MCVVDGDGAVRLADGYGDAGVVLDVDAGGGGVVYGVDVVGGGAVADEDHCEAWVDGDEGCWGSGGLLAVGLAVQGILFALQGKSRRRRCWVAE